MDRGVLARVRYHVDRACVFQPVVDEEVDEVELRSVFQCEAPRHDAQPSLQPTALPSADACDFPSADASVFPSADASVFPSADASVFPSADASVFPCADASVFPSADASVPASADDRGSAALAGLLREFIAVSPTGEEAVAANYICAFLNREQFPELARVPSTVAESAVRLLQTFAETCPVASDALRADHMCKLLCAHHGMSDRVGEK